MNTKEMLEKVKSAVKAAAQIIPTTVEDSDIIGKDGKANYATEYDLAVQKNLFEALRKICPEAKLIGEEDIGETSTESTKAFIVDPIDGTTNFMHGVRKSAICVAYAENDAVLLGVVYDPYADEMFTAVKGGGAYLNGKKISVSERNLENSLVIFGAAPYYEELISKSLKAAEKLLRASQDIRRFGSGALEICYVACGRADVQFELVLCPWDYAAASLVLEEAGGIISDINGGKLSLEKKCSVLSANKVAYEDAKRIISECVGD